jgi:prevent-host-death family protein
MRCIAGQKPRLERTTLLPWPVNHNHGMTMVMATVAAGVFKAKCLELMDEVERTKTEIIVTKHGRPVAKLVPLAGASPGPLFGRARGTVIRVADDAFAPQPDLWKALGE